MNAASEASEAKPPILYWVMAGAATLWNALGVASFIEQVTVSQAQVAEMSAADQAAQASVPVWAVAVYAVAVLTGFIGAVSLLFRKRFAIWFFAASLAAVVVQFGYMLLASNILEIAGARAFIGPMVVTSIAVGLLIFALGARAKGWTR